MTQTSFTRDEKGNRVFLVDIDSAAEKLEGGGMVFDAKTFMTENGNKSKYPIIIMRVGDKAFVPYGNPTPSNPVYSAALNRRASDPSFDYKAYRVKVDGGHGFIIRCIERRSKHNKNKQTTKGEYQND